MKRVVPWSFSLLLVVVSWPEAALRAGDGRWTTTYPFGGPIPPAGLALDPFVPKVAYAAPSFRGIYRTADGGSTWQSLTDDRDPPFNALSLHTLAVAGDGSAIYAVASVERPTLSARPTAG